MREMPEMQALSERLDAATVGTKLVKIDQLGFTGLKTVRPAPSELIGIQVSKVGRRAKYLVVEFANGMRLLVHLVQAGRLDLEQPAKVTKPRGSVVRLVFENGLGVLVREHGSERKARWWVLAPGDDGPLDGLGSDPTERSFVDFISNSADRRRLHDLARPIGGGRDWQGIYRRHLASCSSFAVRFA